jgi:hypothetical protein
VLKGGFRVYRKCVIAFRGGWVSFLLKRGLFCHFLFLGSDFMLNYETRGGVVG